MFRTAVFTLGLTLGALKPAAAEEETIVYSAESTPLFDAKEGKVLGAITPGTPVVQVEKSGKWAKVMVRGWSQQYHELEVFSDHQSRVERLSLARMKESHRKVGGEKVDEWGTTWMEVAIEGWVPKANLVKDASTVWGAAKALYESRCYDCHEFRPAEMLTPSQWRGTLVIMAHRAALTPEEAALLRQYFQTHAKQE